MKATKKLRDYKSNSVACRQRWGVNPRKRKQLKRAQRKSLRLALKSILV